MDVQSGILASEHLTVTLIVQCHVEYWSLNRHKQKHNYMIIAY